MSVPLDNLYHWVESLLPDPAVLYVFLPHGSKKISDLNWFKEYDFNKYWACPGIIMHDQEPLDWNAYNHSDQYLEQNLWQQMMNDSAFDNIKLKYCSKFNLKSIVYEKSGTHYDQAILIHSEKNSTDLEQYQQNGFLCVYYWAHAVIARDWYRFAKIDARLCANTQPKNKFLIYCRDWSGGREYRLKFLELLVQNDLDQYSQVNLLHTNSDGVHFLQHQFINPTFALTNPESINCVPANTFASTASADYQPEDFANSEISVVLETVFDGNRIHLTEKILRPIACGHPFVLAAGPGALEYLRSYGFKTFAPWIDESYDLESDGVRRLEKIIKTMKKIQNLQGQELEDFTQAIKTIADHNKQHFFSEKFFDLVKYELQTNLEQAFDLAKQTQGKHYLELLKQLKKQAVEYPRYGRLARTQLLRQLRQSCQLGHSSPQVNPSA